MTPQSIKTTATILAAILTTCLACATGHAHADPAPQQTIEAPPIHQLPTGRVTRILDENTLLIRVQDRTLRYDLLGVATAGLNDRQRALCQDTLKRLTIGETVAIQHDPRGALTPANRLAAFLFRTRDHACVNLELVRNGYARHTDAWITLHRQPFRDAQERARRFELGIWSRDQNDAPPDPHHALTRPEHQTPPDTPPNPGQPQTEADTVYITAHGKRFHREGCPHLTDSARPVPRGSVQSSHQPCKTCQP